MSGEEQGGGAHRRPEEQLGSSRRVNRGLAALLRCGGQEGKEWLDTITTSAKVRFKVFKVM